MLMIYKKNKKPKFQINRTLLCSCKKIKVTIEILHKQSAQILKHLNCSVCRRWGLYTMDPRRSEITATYSQFVITVYLFATWLYTLFCYHHHSLSKCCGRGRGWLRAWDSAPSGNSDPRLVLYLLPQAAVGHWRLQGTDVGRVRDGIPCVAELLINARILGNVGGGGGVDHQAEQDDEEREQVESWKLKRREFVKVRFTVRCK